MVSSPDPVIDPDLPPDAASATLMLDEMDDFYEVGPDPWLAERVRLDGESDEVRFQARMNDLTVLLVWGG